MQHPEALHSPWGLKSWNFSFCSSSSFDIHGNSSVRTTANDESLTFQAFAGNLSKLFKSFRFPPPQLAAQTKLLKRQQSVWGISFYLIVGVPMTVEVLREEIQLCFISHFHILYIFSNKILECICVSLEIQGQDPLYRYENQTVNDANRGGEVILWSMELQDSFTDAIDY